DNVEALFTGDEAAERAPEAIYPNDEVVVPPNLGRMEVHWLKGAGDNTVFAVSFTNAVTDVTAYLRCERPAGVNPNGCIWEPSGDAWKWVAETNRGGNPVEIRVRGTTDAGGTFGVSDPIRVRFSRDDIDGTLYYWTTSGNTKIVRYDFGAAAGAATDVMGPMSNSAGKCVGCHAISHDGSKIMASAGGQGSGGLVLVDLNGPSVVADQSNGHVIQFGSFRPDGSELVGIYGDDQGHVTYDLILFDTRCDTANMATCGAPTGTISLGGREASHPEWSPNDDRIVYTDVGFHRTSQKPGAGAIGYVDRTQNGWSAAKTLVARADGKNRYSPTFAPDGSFVVYNESTCAGGNVASDDCDADSDPSAKIWGVSSEGGTPVALERATAPGALESTTDFQATFPRFTPFVFVLEDQELGGRRVMWLTYASRRNYGLRTHDGGLTTWLWMTAIDPDAVLSGDDGSFPAFALPFQDLTTSNHIGVWTTKAVGDPLLL
ncbi:MAG: hypothetical protein KC417_05675, partial [Myxococcales bacterium]|nr:hypothetical protein [Myxococcales bacterium]